MRKSPTDQQQQQQQHPQQQQKQFHLDVNVGTHGHLVQLTVNLNQGIIELHMTFPLMDERWRTTELSLIYPQADYLIAPATLPVKSETKARHDTDTGTPD